MVLLKTENQATAVVTFYYNAGQDLNRKERKHQETLLHPVYLGKSSTYILRLHVWDPQNLAEIRKAMTLYPDFCMAKNTHDISDETGAMYFTLKKRLRFLGLCIHFPVKGGKIAPTLITFDRSVTSILNIKLSC